MVKRITKLTEAQASRMPEWRDGKLRHCTEALSRSGAQLMSDSLPRSVDRMPPDHRKPRCGPLLDPDEVVMVSLNSVSHLPERWPFDLDSAHVRAVIEGLRLAGYRIVPATKQDDTPIGQEQEK